MVSVGAALERAVRAAEPEWSLFNDLASPAARSAAWVLAVSLGTDLDTLGSALSYLWPEIDSHEAIEDLRWLMFVHEAGTELYLSRDFAHRLSLEFRGKDPDRFRKAHEFFLAEEEATGGLAGDLEWARSTTIAFYLSALDPPEAVRQFGRRFVDAPEQDQTANRIWVCDLVGRQSYLLTNQRRELQFFGGFELYVAHRYDRAGPMLDEVVDLTVGMDYFGAVALHLTAAIRSRNGDYADAIRRCERAIEASVDLRLKENEVMARNTLIMAMIRSISQTDDERARESILRKADVLAKDNLASAEGSGVGTLIRVTTWTKLVIEWQVLTDQRRRTVPLNVAERIASAHDRLFERCLREHDAEGAAESLNEEASVYRDVGRPSQAVEVLAERIEQVPFGRVSRQAIQGLAQTAGSLQRLVYDRDDVALLEQVRGALNRIQQRRS